MGIFDFFNGKKEDKIQKKENDLFLSKVEVVPGLFVPMAFVSNWNEIEKTKLPLISIKATHTEDLALEQSKFGHFPCLPQDFDYPKDDQGRFMLPLAQINCRELPALQGYPTSGYLQFYISGFDDLLGLDFDDPQLQKNFRVLFFEESEVEKYKVDFSFLESVMMSDSSPVNKPHSLVFTAKEEFVGLGDVRCEKNEHFHLDHILKKYPAIESSLEDAAYETFCPNGHKIGGYAYFTQSDPREYNEKFKDFILLLQIDSDDEIMWGDSGVANFFIHPDDLAKKDFSKVLYNWDCC